MRKRASREAVSSEAAANTTKRVCRLTQSGAESRIAGLKKLGAKEKTYDWPVSAMSLGSVDNDYLWADDEKMNTTTDKDYIDSKLETISAKMVGEVRAIAVEMAGERKSFEAKMDGNISLIKEILEKRQAESAASWHKSTVDLLKWEIGIMIAVAGFSLAYLTFLINNSAPKTPLPPAAPIIVYAQPAQAAPISPSPTPAAKK